MALIEIIRIPIALCSSIAACAVALGQMPVLKPAQPPTGAAKPAAGQKPATAGAQQPAPAATQPPVGPPPFAKPNRPLSAITAVAFSPDGKHLAVGTYGEAVVFDTATWQQSAVCRQVEDSVRSIAFNPDCHTVALGGGLPGRSGQTEIWDTAATQPPRALPQQYDSVESVAYDKSGKGLLVGADDNKVRYVADAGAGGGTVLDSHNGRVQAVAFSPKEQSIFISGGMDKIVKVWDLKSVKNVINFDQSDGGITGLAFLNNGDQFVGASLDGKLYWWGVGYDAKKASYNGYHFRTIGAHNGGVYALSRSADGRRMITGGADHAICVWDLNSGGQVRAFRDTTSEPVYAAALSPDGKIAAAGGRDGLVYVLDVDANKPITTLVPPPLPAEKPSAPAKPAKSARRAGKTKR